MRGKVSNDLRRNIRIGITPAYAGKRSISTILFFTNWDHPRLCGEKGECVDLVKKHLWITPAYAGKRGFGLFPNLCI